MNPTTTDPLVLIIEDSVVTSVAAGRVIENTLPNCRIIRAQSCFEAEILLRAYDFHLFIIDIHLPDGCGLDLLGLIIAKDPNAPTIVLTADGSPEHRDRSVAFGVQHFLTKPFRPEVLSDAVRQSVAQYDGADPEPMFAVSLKRLSILDVVQLKCLNRASTRLEVSATGVGLRVGFIDLEEGEIINAEVQDETFEVVSEGLDAMSELLGWREGRIEEVNPTSSQKHTIVESWQSLLLHTAQTVDEREQKELVGAPLAAQASESRAPCTMGWLSFEYELG